MSDDAYTFVPGVICREGEDVLVDYNALTYKHFTASGELIACGKLVPTKVLRDSQSSPPNPLRAPL